MLGNHRKKFEICNIFLVMSNGMINFIHTIRLCPQIVHPYVVVSWIIFSISLFWEMDIDRGIQWVIDYLDWYGWHDHGLLLKGVHHLVSQMLVGAWSKLFASHDIFLMTVPQELIWHWIWPQHLSGLSSIIVPSYESLWFLVILWESFYKCKYENYE